MELQIYTPTADAFVQAIEWNHEEIKAEITEKVAFYNGIVYDEEQIKEAKADRAELNKFKKTLEDKRKEIKQRCLAPYESFEKQMKEIVAIIEQPIGVIDSQVKAFEEKQKEEKRKAILEYIDTKDLHGIDPAQLANAKWLNASTTLKSVYEEIDKICEDIEADIQIINDLPEYNFEALEVYKSSRDIRAALGEAKRLTDLAKQKAEWEAKKAAEAEAEAARKAEEEARKEEELAAKAEAAEVNCPAAEPQQEEPELEEDFLPDFDNIKTDRTWVVIKAFANPGDIEAIKDFLDSRSIQSEILGE